MVATLVTRVEMSEELFETLASMADEGSQLVVTLDNGYAANAKLCPGVHCEGATLPQSEVKALVRDEETQLSHGSSLGLWLVNWIGELSGGSLSFRTSEDGQDVCLGLVEA